MPLWLKILAGPLPATVLLLPLLVGGGGGSVFALIELFLTPEPGGMRWLRSSLGGPCCS